MPYPCTVAQFVKAPILGQVKTRLQNTLGEQACLDLHCRLAEFVLRQLYSVSDVYELWVTESVTQPFFESLQQNYGIHLMQQVGGDLGERLLYASKTIIERKQVAILIGSDCPFLTEEYLASAQYALTQKNYDAVIGPALDGGYVLLGLRRTSAQLFLPIHWGSSSVLKETQTQLENMGWRYKLLPALNDIDRPEDLALLEGLL